MLRRKRKRDRDLSAWGLGLWEGLRLEYTGPFAAVEIGGLAVAADSAVAVLCTVVGFYFLIA